ncbi:hypothetical protein [Microbispora sp. NPDC049633]|uniref:hypothetical protein n=1 Tax=Microbispora sp. NPDC049633 TaxID=3154355 RepID=UPI0034427966
MAKVFTGMVSIPGDWMETVLRRNHHPQANMMVVAHQKSHVAPLLTDRGVGQWAADRWSKDLRMRRPPYFWQPVVALFESGLASLEQPGVYVWDLDGGRDKPVVRLELDGTLTVLGHFARNDAGGMTVVPVAEKEE